ncbi:MAG: ATP-binding cassette domain-containing protein [Chloroflexi bacterium]|uniref:ABC transporter ATP-binding protein n=1 Tax=Candidatus Flexifilum breve TaxID=3140694 RepID=UPI0031359E94|nr:ATP-binding cassette domain-containing protein [Chloroflexota bacterium]
MPQQVAISIDHISKTYGDFRAVNNLSFEVYGGEIFAMLGPNGAGKSTTIRMILDILKPDSGKISVFGAPISDAAKNRIGYLPEERGLYRNVPVLEMMVYLGLLKGLTPGEARKRALRYLEQVDLGEHAKKKVSELSKGMQQKVQFGVTMLHEPDLILIDEPFSGLDPVNTQVIETLIRDFKARGGAVVMSTHQMYQVEEMADRLLMINRGEQKLYGNVSDVRAQYALPAVNVEGRGDWASISGVDHVEQKQNGRASALLYLKPNVKPDDVLGEIARRDDIFIQRFELAVPSLNEIFIQVVAGDKHRE